jgi:carboxypeptidase family protein
MPTDDREQRFERALARHLRDAADSTCPDAEILAAYHQRTLSLDEMTKWKEHIGTCERCQETLAFVEQTENVDAEEWKEQDRAVVLKQAAARPTPYRAAAAEIPVGESNRTAAASLAAPVSMAKRRPRAQWKWMVPIGALAAGAIVWIGANQVRTQHGKPAAAVEIAENRQAATPAPVPQARLPQTEAVESKPSETAAPSAPASVAAPESTSTASQFSYPDRMIAPGAVPPAKEALNKKKEAPSSGMGYGSGAGIAPQSPSPIVTGARNEAAPAPSQNAGILGGAAGGASAERVEAPMATAGAARAVAADKLAANSHAANLSAITGTVLDPSGAGISGAVITAIDTSSGNAKTAVADATGKFRLTDLPSDQYRVIVAHAGFASSEQVLTLKPQRNEQVQVQLKLGAVAESVEVSGAAATLNTASADLSTYAKSAKPSESELSTPGRNVNQLIQMAAANPRYIVAPDQEMVWRVGEAGKIERSTDRGKSWKPQRSGVSVDLRAGSATSDGVCWLIGKAGTILLTTDGGKHWKQVTSPIAEDLGGIHASDAQHASIWDVPNRKSFETDDGGTTWKRTANE